MAFARRALTVLIAVALAVLPLGAATATMHAPAAKHMSASAHVGHAMSHDHATMTMVATAEPHGANHCDHTAPDSNCCDDDGTCLQKCFGQLAVMPPDRSARQMLVHRFAALIPEWLPSWSLTPQPLPPRV